MKSILFILSSLILVSCSTVDGIKKDYKEGKLFKTERPARAFFYRKWTKELDLNHQQTGNLPVNTSSPFIHDMIVYQGSMNGHIHAYSLENGRSLWSFNEGQSISSQASFFEDHILYGTNAGRFISRHYLTGNLKYQVDVGSSIEVQPFFYRGRAFLHTRDHRIICLDASTGKILWSFKRTVPYVSTIQGASKPIAHKNSIIVGFADGNLVGINIDDGLLQWEKKLSTSSKFVDVDTTAVIFKKLLYTSSLSGQLSQINPNSGEVLKTYPITASGKPVFLNENMVVPGIDGRIYILGLEGAIEKSFLLDKFSPVTNIQFWKNAIIASNTKGNVYKINRRSFEVEEKLSLGSVHSAVYGKLHVKDDHLAIFSSRSRLYIIE